MISFHFLLCYSQTMPLTFNFFPFVYLKISKQNYFIPFEYFLFSIPFHYLICSISFHSLIIYSFIPILLWTPKRSVRLEFYHEAEMHDLNESAITLWMTKQKLKLVMEEYQRSTIQTTSMYSYTVEPRIEVTWLECIKCALLFLWFSLIVH